MKKKRFKMERLTYIRPDIKVFQSRSEYVLGSASVFPKTPQTGEEDWQEEDQEEDDLEL